MPSHLVGIGDLFPCRTRVPGLPTDFRVLWPRCNFGTGLTSSSDDGGLDELPEFCPSCRRNSAFSAASRAFSASSAATAPSTAQ
ncbi:hypothetical protein JOF55_004335 [Haloactinomyces albus]|uniref:Uncharacterized protein n=1 Tax=Haloactinomyces albus TaxID=1352928 RepID=A0AAE3ZJR6_9ACTN|nr:hypothetical protein [Haloactinomyces albus]